MAIFNGYYGHISKDGSALSCIQEWSVTETSSQASSTCSSTQGAMIRSAAKVSWSGSYKARGAIPAILPGALGVPAVFVGAMTGSGEAAVGVSGTIECSSVTINIPVEAGEHITHTVNFVGTGQLTHGTVTCPADTGSTPGQLSAVGLIAEVAPGPAFTEFTEIADIRSMSLTLTAETKSANSSTTGIYSVQGAFGIDASATIEAYAQDDDGVASFPEPGLPYALRLYVNATEFWLLNYVICASRNPNINIAGREYVGASMSFDWTGFLDISGTPTQGEITDPTPTTLWPPEEE
jgi:hypothetical protein